MNLSPRIKLLLAGILFLLIALPVLVSLLQKPQNTQSKASASTTLSLIPQPGTESSIQKNVGETFSVDLMIDPGSNAVLTVTAQIKYDPTKLQPTGDIFAPNISKFPTVLEGPTVNNGTVSQIISVGFDTTKAITAPTKAGTFTFKTLAKTPDGTPTIISFSTLSKATSADTTGQARENVLSTTNPASITIVDSGVTPPPGDTALSFTILLHGIGSAGDTANPTGNSLSNKNPRTPQKQLTVGLFDSNDQQVTSGTDTITYDTETGTYKGQIPLPNVATGKYTIKIKSDRYLRRAFSGVVSLTHGQTNVLPQIELVAGDTDGDNALNIIDYNALLDCGYGALNPLPITNTNAPYNSAACKTHEPRINIDIDDNGFVNAFDYTLFIRELSVQAGD